MCRYRNLALPSGAVVSAPMDVVVGRRLRALKAEAAAALATRDAGGGREIVAAGTVRTPPAELTLMDDPPPQRARWSPPAESPREVWDGPADFTTDTMRVVSREISAGCPHCGATVRQAHTVGCYGVGGVVLP